MKKLHVVGAAILQGDRVLAARRGESKYAYVAHKFEFAGGKVEEGESEEGALRREIAEELGAEIEVQGSLLRSEYVYPDFAVDLSVYICRLKGGYRAVEHEALVWLPLASLDEREWAPADAAAVRALRALAEKGAR